MTQTERRQEWWESVHDCQWATNRTDPQWWLSNTLDVPLQAKSLHRYLRNYHDRYFGSRLIRSLVHTTQNEPRTILLQMVTYYLWWVLWYFKEFKNAKLSEWQKTLLSLRSNLQTMSPYIHDCDGLCTKTDYHMLLPIVLYMVVPLY